MSVLTGYPDVVDAAVLYAPVHADMWENFNRWRRKRPEGDNTLKKYGPKDEKPEFWEEISPVTYLEKIQAPILLFQGGRDADVPQEWSDGLNDRLKELGKDIEYIEYEKEGHEFSTQWKDFMKRTVEFFEKKLQVQ